jgi:predicted nucleotidyltransferase
MPDQTALRDPVLKCLRAALDQAYGERISRVILYGSRARGDHRRESDYDIAVFLKSAGSFFEENRRLAAVITDLSLETGTDISAIPFPAEAYLERTGFMHELRLDGVEI